MSIELSSQGEDAVTSGGFELSATALLHTIFNLTDGIMIVGREGQIVMANPACERIFGYGSGQLRMRIFGYGSGQLRMRLFSELIQSDLANEPDSLVEWLAAGGSCGIAGVTHELQGRRANGELFLAAVTVGYVDNNGWLYFSVAVRNNTAQRKYEKELIEGKKEAERATQAKALFLANMSHEIRTPMNGILGMLQLLEETPLDNTQRDYVDVAKSSAENLLHIVNDVLDISKAESGKLQFEHIEFNLAELVKHTIALMAKAADDKGLKLISLVGAEIPAKLLGDPTRLRQILLNLVGNAIKFTSQGEITVAVAMANGSKQGAELFNNSLRQPGTLVCSDTAILRFDVVDTGIGVSAEILPNLFQNFQQADVSTTRRFGGTGLGLALAKRLVEGMCGRIGVESVVGRGADFWFELPFGCGSSETVTASCPAKKFLSGRSVVIGGMGSTCRSSLEVNLVSWGAQYRIVLNSDELVKLVQDPGFLVDLILLGSLADADTRLCAQIKQARPKVKVVQLLERDAAHSPVLDSLSQTVDGILVMPIRCGQLHATLAKLLPASRKSHRETRVTDKARASTARILVVDDNPVNRLVLLGLLKRLVGPNVIGAEGGEEAIAMAREQLFDLVFMDIQMPDMDGFQAAAGIRALDGYGKRIPVIAVTAHAMEGDKERCLERGMDDFMSKPVVPAKIGQILDKWLPASNEVFE